jgi:hypothetical protein
MSKKKDKQITKTGYSHINEQGEHFVSKYGKIENELDTMIIWNDSLYAIYKKGILQEIGKKEMGQKKGIWYFYHNAQLSAVVEYENDSTFNPVKLINTSW